MDNDPILAEQPEETAVEPPENEPCVPNPRGD
jgi:hypothetical protein